MLHLQDKDPEEGPHQHCPIPTIRTVRSLWWGKVGKGEPDLMPIPIARQVHICLRRHPGEALGS